MGYTEHIKDVLTLQETEFCLYEYRHWQQDQSAAPIQKHDAGTASKSPPRECAGRKQVGDRSFP